MEKLPYGEETDLVKLEGFELLSSGPQERTDRQVSLQGFELQSSGPQESAVVTILIEETE